MTSSPAISQAKPFAFLAEDEAIISQILSKYPPEQAHSAVMPLLYLAQQRNEGWLSPGALAAVGDLIAMPYLKVYEIASFYTMFYLQPMGHYNVQVCTTTPCWLRGSDAILEVCKKNLNIDVNGVTADGRFGVTEVECLGACVNAPMVQINDTYYENLTPESMAELLIKLGSDAPQPCDTKKPRAKKIPSKKIKDKP